MRTLLLLLLASSTRTLTLAPAGAPRRAVAPRRAAPPEMPSAPPANARSLLQPPPQLAQSLAKIAAVAPASLGIAP